MPDSQWRDLLAAGYQALHRGDLAAASAVFDRAATLAQAPEIDEAQSTVGFAREDWASTRHHAERAFAAYRARGDLRDAARVATALARLHYGGFCNRAASRGWLSRARRLLADCEPCVDHGYLELAMVACWTLDIAALQAAADRALAIAREYEDGELEVRALADSGLALVSAGHVSEGLARLDEAMAAVTAGEVRQVPLVLGIFCAMLSACSRCGDASRAAEWTRLIEDYWIALGVPMAGFLFSHCRTEYGAVLCSVGRWEDGETEILAAFERARDGSLLSLLDSLAQLARLRIDQGRIEEAAALLHGWEDRPETVQAVARLQLANGEPAQAAATIAGAVAMMVGDRLRRGSLLSLLVEATTAAGAIDDAAAAAQELDALSIEAESVVLRAEARLAAGRVALAANATTEAARKFESALGALGNDERPFLASTIRLELAQTLITDDPVRAAAEATAAFACFSRLGAAPSADRARALLRQLGVRVPVGAAKASSPTPESPLSDREREVADLIAAGLSNNDIAGRLFLSVRTVEHHVSRILTKLALKRRSEVGAALMRTTPR